MLETTGNPLVWGELKMPGATRTLLSTRTTTASRSTRRTGGSRRRSRRSCATAGWKTAPPSRGPGDARDLRGRPAHLRAIGVRRQVADRRVLAALDALKASGLQPTSNIRVILDGEEEAGSPSLVPAIAKYRDKLDRRRRCSSSTVPCIPSERPTIVFGARGNFTLQLTVFGPKFPLHSGHYGNWVPNPAMRLAQLLATMKDDDGKVLVKGFNDGLAAAHGGGAGDARRRARRSRALQALFGIAAPERRGLQLQEALQSPSLNVRGLSSAFVGDEARTIIPDHGHRRASTFAS